MRRLVIVGFLALVLACGSLAQDTDFYSTVQVLAEQGNAPAQYNLGLMYARGEGVPQDYTEAVKWFRLAAEQGNAKAKKNRDIMADRMTREQIPEAQRLAREWKPKTWDELKDSLP